MQPAALAACGGGGGGKTTTDGRDGTVGGGGRCLLPAVTCERASESQIPGLLPSSHPLERPC